MTHSSADQPADQVTEGSARTAQSTHVVQSTNAGDAAAGGGGMRESRLSWRVVDLITAAVLGVASGLLFVLWDQIAGFGIGALEAVTPGLDGLMVGGWLVGGLLGALIIRKPGAAILVEVVGACIEAAIGSQWGLIVLWEGLLQGVGVEIAFALFRYRKSSTGVAALGGMLSAITQFVDIGITHGNFAKGPTYLLVSFVCMCISGLVLAGAGSWLIMKGLAATGALDRFPVARERVRI